MGFESLAISLGGVLLLIVRIVEAGVLATQRWGDGSKERIGGLNGQVCSAAVVERW